MRTGRILTAAVAVGMVAAVIPAGVASASTSSAARAGTSFYTYTGSKPLGSMRPGTVLKTRTIKYHLEGLPTPVTVTQLLYRSTNARQKADAAVTSVITPPGATSITKVVAYQSFYDSLDPADGPSRYFGGTVRVGGGLNTTETGIIAPLLLQGYGVVIADDEGPTADFVAGPEYGMVTLDSLRAALASKRTHITRHAKIALMGYSGGAIATDWASVLAPRYAPDVNRRLIGAAEGGVLVDPAHNLRYISGSEVWAGVAVMAFIGGARAYHADLLRYLSAYGRQVYDTNRKASIVDVLGHYPGLTFQQLAKRKYSNPNKIKIYAELVNRLNLGSRPAPTVPMFIGQGADGTLEGTSGTTKGIGAGDGVMVTGDVRSLARKYCRSGERIDYQQYDALSHTTAIGEWATQASLWVNSRFAGQQAPQNCSSIAPGNPLTPIPVK